MGAERMGMILFRVAGSSTRAEGRDAGHAIATVRAAATRAGIPVEFFRDIQPRSAFIRAMGDMMRRDLVDADFRDKAADDADIIRFAFIARLAGMQYAANFVVEFSKANEEIRIVKAPENLDPAEIVAAARREIEAAKQRYGMADIHRAVERYLASKCRRIMLRDGVYFLPSPHEPLGSQVQEFFKILGLGYMAYHIGYNPVDAEVIQGAIVDDLVKRAHDLKAKLEQARAKGGVTQRLARSQIREIRRDLRHYSELARATQIQMDRLLRAAGESGRILRDAALTPEQIMQRAESGKPVSAEALELFAGVPDDYAAVSVEKLQRVEALPLLDLIDSDAAVLAGEAVVLDPVM